ncbi:hypothetical protein GGQ64_005348 [Rhizobium azooxidifex]|uniref:Portal protein n=1 Tax=Mycoplana azooxidifex TaxID=1636188 RepID=A0A7W6GLF4_9HYPH|nr:hypothetical protein [Mycoplana azooxidifex]MBB3980101.1 hypothetical protein [Mycoplana azooxidifex]
MAETEVLDSATPTPPAPTAQEPSPTADVPEATRLLVKQWTDRVCKAKEHYKKTFKRMRENQDFARLGATKEWAESGKYTVPILARHINQTVSAIYARNPKSIAERRKRLMFSVWDGREDSLTAAMEMAAMGDPQGMAILQEIQQAMQANLMLDRMGQTVSLLWQYYLDEQGANYKQQFKALVRRAKVCKVGWVKLSYQRILEPNPDVAAQIPDITSKIENIELALSKMETGDAAYGEQSAEKEQLRLNLADLERDKEMVVREGPVLSFPRANQVIVDPECTHLKTLSGAGWVAEEFEKSPDEILKLYKVDIKTDFKWYASDGNPYDKDPKDCKARVYQVHDKENQQEFVICEGYPGFLREPKTPDVWLERFWPYFPLVFNEIEHDCELYPQSDVEHAKDIQNEYNRSREGLRQHRIAARPYYVTAKGLEKDEKDRLAYHGDHEIIEMPTLAADQKVSDLIQRGPVANIDPNLYEVEGVFNDLMRAVGTQEAQLGGMSGGTATEASIGEQSTATSKSDNVDDLDEMLSDLFRAAGQVMFMNVQKQTVVEIVGPGAVWPDTLMSRNEASKEILLTMEAGSSGRPNRAAELANLERAAPYLMQIPGINPKPLSKKWAGLLDLDPDELNAEGAPSITAINAMMSKMAVGGGPVGGDPASDPNAQGGQGAQNAPSTQANEPGPQPGYPAPAPGAA